MTHQILVSVGLDHELFPSPVPVDVFRKVVVVVNFLFKDFDSFDIGNTSSHGFHDSSLRRHPEIGESFQSEIIIN